MMRATESTGWAGVTDGILRAEPWIVQPRSSSRLVLLAVLVTFGALYGAVMGAFALSPTQILYSALKAPLLVLTSFALGLPSFFVVSTLLGLRDDFAFSLRALLAAQASFSIVLASLAPITTFMYASGIEYDAAVVWNGLMFLIASLAAQHVLRKLYTPLILRNSRHRVALFSWLIIYCFVAVQMAWMLRPFVGAPNLPPIFIRGTELGNAYVAVGAKLWTLLTLGQ